MKAEELDKRFDEGEDILDYFDLSTLKRPGLEQKSVDLNFPQWMMMRLDEEAKRLGISRQALIQTWIKERLETL
ncbi:MAG: type II toxin-antitoxin system BrnA family antitoxin [Spirulinaceae cyanobacterium]